MPNIRVVNQQYHKDFLKMWIKGRFIEVLAKDLENQLIADGKKTPQNLSFQDCEITWFNAISVKLEGGVLLN